MSSQEPAALDECWHTITDRLHPNTMHHLQMTIDIRGAVWINPGLEKLELMGVIERLAEQLYHHAHKQLEAELSELRGEEQP